MFISHSAYIYLSLSFLCINLLVKTVSNVNPVHSKYTHIINLIITIENDNNKLGDFKNMSNHFEGMQLKI